MLKFYLTIFGINPYKSVRVNNIIVTTILTGCFSVCTPLAIKFYYSMCDKYYDEIFDDFPQVVMAFLIITKFINIHSNQAGVFQKIVRPYDGRKTIVQFRRGTLHVRRDEREGYRVIKTTENYVAQKFEAGTDMSGYEDFKRCVTLHHEALRYYNVLDNTCRNLYLVQMGINMILISVTAVKLIMYLEQLDQAIRSAMFLAGQQFHLYIISLPGQKLLDQSSELSNQIYASSWYETSVVIQKLLHTMQIRSSRSSILTAAGLYEMKIESFGITVKTCVSYCTMFLSLRD
ncbi:unnamed protein product [Xylocopa violacea]|uniref:Uncharacterized protein n=1 Tax=Xylocopa violacea TaxID=135666 RepID=A0ABP1N669_XYLVO